MDRNEGSDRLKLSKRIRAHNHSFQDTRGFSIKGGKRAITKTCVS